MKKNLLFVVFLLILSGVISAQVAINNSGDVADPSAILDLQSTTKGFLVPRVTSAQRNLIGTTQSGLLVYDITTESFWYYNNTQAQWVDLGNGSGVSSIDDLTDAISHSFSVFLGSFSGIHDDGSNNNNTGVGVYSLYSVNSGSNNSAVGRSSLGSNSTGSNNSALGFGAAYLNQTGNSNVAIGYNSLYRNTNKSNIVAIGDSALFYNGSGAIYSWQSSLNTAVGSKALLSNTTGYNNSGIGNSSLHNNTSGFSNTSLGANSMYENVTGYQNTSVGSSSLRSNISGYSNTAIGSASLYENETGNSNVALGERALQYNVSGSSNTAIGLMAGRGLEGNSVSGCIYLGYYAGYNNLADDKLFIDNSDTDTPLIGGDFSSNQVDINGTIKITGGIPGNGKVLTSDAIGLASWNTPTWASEFGELTDANYLLGSYFLGTNAGSSITSGSANHGFADYALESLTTGTNNLAIGKYSQNQNVSGWSNVSIGINSLRYNVTGSGNTVIGFSAGSNSTGGSFSNCVIIGYNAGINNTEDNKLFIDNSNTSTPLIGGDFSTNQVDINGTIKITGGLPGNGKVLTSDATGLASWTTPAIYASSINDLSDAIYDNTSLFMGYLAGNNDDGGNYNLGIGREALTSLTTGQHNTALGYKALATCNADDNTAVGINALRYTTTGTQNTASGMNALRNNTTGSFNTGIGYEALLANTEGHVNSAFGISALLANTTGSFNSALGYLALGDNTTGTGNTAIGYGSIAYNVSGNYNTAIGYNSFVTTSSYSNSTALGYSSPINGSNQIHLGNTSITEIKGQVSFTTYSDGRIKENIKENVKGLDFILKLRPVTYNINLDEENRILGITDKLDLPNKYDIEQVIKTGFIAQEVEAAAREVNYDFSGIQTPKNEHDLYGLSYSEFVVPLVKSVQELNEKLEKENAELKARIEKLEQLIIK